MSSVPFEPELYDEESARFRGFAATAVFIDEVLSLLLPPLLDVFNVAEVFLFGADDDSVPVDVRTVDADRGEWMLPTSLSPVFPGLDRLSE